MKRVVVTGVGLVTPLGVKRANVWPRLIAGHCGAKRLDILKDLPSQIAAPVPRQGDSKNVNNDADAAAAGAFSASDCRFLERGDERSIAPFAQFALMAAADALDDAGWNPQTDMERERTGVAIGSGIGALGDIVEAADTLQGRGHRRVSPYFIPRMLVNMAAGQVSIRAGVRGPMAAPATACATGAHALSDAWHLISSGAADVMLAGGAEACIEPLAVAGFSRLRALSTQFNDDPERASRPFDASRDGFVLGEGAAVLVLESAEHAERRGATVLAELRGTGLSADAHHITSPPDDGEGALRAMRAALRFSSAVVHGGGDGDGGGVDLGAAIDRLDYVNAHATSTPTGDAAELRAVGALVAGRRDGAPPVLISSTKGATGHLLGAAGAVEAAFTVLALHHQQAPPTLNLERADPDDVPGVEHVVVGGGAEGTRRPLQSALCNSFGFGGVNVSLLFERAEQ